MSDDLDYEDKRREQRLRGTIGRRGLALHRYRNRDWREGRYYVTDPELNCYVSPEALVDLDAVEDWWAWWAKLRGLI